jgi:hypothetical protein
MNTNINVGQLISQIGSIITQVIGYGLLLLIAAAVVGRYGVKVPWVPAVNVTELCYLAGAWWLYRGGKP